MTDAEDSIDVDVETRHERQVGYFEARPSFADLEGTLARLLVDVTPRPTSNDSGPISVYPSESENYASYAPVLAPSGLDKDARDDAYKCRESDLVAEVPNDAALSPIRAYSFVKVTAEDQQLDLSHTESPTAKTPIEAHEHALQVSQDGDAALQPIEASASVTVPAKDRQPTHYSSGEHMLEPSGEIVSSSEEANAFGSLYAVRRVSRAGGEHVLKLQPAKATTFPPAASPSPPATLTTDSEPDTGTTNLMKCPTSKV
jgi:hypothetical protein